MNRILRPVLLAAAMMMAAATAWAQMDVTSQYLRNADLSTDPGNDDNGWTLLDDWRTDYQTAHDDIHVNVVEFYAGWGSLDHTQFALTQTTTLPPGDYRIAVNAFYRQGDPGSGTNDGKAWIFAGEFRQDIYPLGNNLGSFVGTSDLWKASNAFYEGYYSNEFDFSLQEESTIELGFKGTFDQMRSWVILGPVKLYKYSLDDYLTDYRARVAVADELLTKAMMASTRTALQQAIVDEATFSLSSQVTAAILALNAAINAATASAAAYERLKTALDEADAYIDVAMNYGASGSRKDSVDAIRDAYTAGTIDDGDIDGVLESIETLLNEVAREQTMAGADMTRLLKNPYFEQGEYGWTVVAAEGNSDNGRAGNVRPGGSDTNQCFEAWNSPSFDIYQTVDDAHVGVYEIEVQGFYRYLRDYNAWYAYQEQQSPYVQKDGVPVYVYMNNNATPFVNIFAEPVEYGTLYTNSMGGDTYIDPNHQYWYPDQMSSSAEAFSAGMYKQSAFGLVAREGDEIRLGVKGVSNQGNDSWVIWDNFKLTYRGFQADMIKPVLQTAMDEVDDYLGLLMGRTEYEALTTAYNNALQGIAENDGETMFQALIGLWDAKEPARVSKDIFLEAEVAADTLSLAQAINNCSHQHLSQQTMDDAIALLTALRQNTRYENGQTAQLKSDVSEMMNRLYNSVEYYAQLNDALNNLWNELDGLSQRMKQLVATESAQASTAYETAMAQYVAGSLADEDVDAVVATLKQALTALREAVANSGITDSGTETEMDAQGGTGADIQIDGESYYISAGYVAGQGNKQIGDMTSKGFKLRTVQNGGQVVFTVNYPYIITDLTLVGVSNYARKADGDAIRVTKVEVDGVETTFEGGGFPDYSLGESGTLRVTGINAMESIAIWFDNSNAQGGQLGATYAINWDCRKVTQPLISVEPDTLALVTDETYKLTAKVSPSTFSTYWYSDNTNVATVGYDGTVYPKASGQARIIHAWDGNRQVSDTTVLNVTNLGVLEPFIVKTYDFTQMGDITLTTASESAGRIYNAGNNRNTEVYACTNEGLELLAIQMPLDDGNRGWTIRDGVGLYMGTGAGRCAAIGGLLAGQIVELVYTGSLFYTSDTDDGAARKPINQSVGRAIYQLTEDGMLGFELGKGCAIERINIYQKKSMLLADLNYSVPGADVLYDGQQHAAKVLPTQEMGLIHIIYVNAETGDEMTEAPSAPGTYSVTLTMDESELYISSRLDGVATFTIYEADAQELLLLQQVDASTGNHTGWDFSQGTLGASRLAGVGFKKGHVASVYANNRGLTGTFPIELLSLPSLETLNLSNNQLTGDIGLLMAAYVQQQPTMQSALQELDVSNNQLTGNIGLFAQPLTALTSLDASHNRLSDVYPTLPTTISAYLSCQTIDRIIDIDLSNLSTEALLSQMPSILLYDHANQTYATSFTTDCYNAARDWGMEMVLNEGRLQDIYPMTANYAYQGDSGDTLQAVFIHNRWGDQSTFYVKLSFSQGDANFDGEISVLDLQSSICYFFDEETGRPYNLTAADLWTDGLINVQDIVKTVDLLLQQDNSATDGARARQQSDSQPAEACVYLSGSQLVISASRPVAAFDITVGQAESFAVESQLKAMGMTTSVRQGATGWHIVGYSMQGATLPAGETVIGSAAGAAYVSHARLSDATAQAIATDLNTTPTGIATVGRESQSGSVVYDLTGRKLNRPAKKGLYIENGEIRIKN